MVGGGGGTSKSNAPKARKRVEVDSSATSSLKRAHDGSAFTRCDKCNRHVAVALIDFHDCHIQAQIDKSLDAQMAEHETSDAIAAEKRKAKSTEPKAKKVKKEKKTKDPNLPKRPQTAFFLFMDEFRKSYKKANPDCKSVAAVAKEGGEKWKSMTDEEKKAYVDRAAELKAEYTRALKSNNEPKNADDEVSQEEETQVEPKTEVVTVSDTN
ncbi:High mobility group B protein like [Actinidia chinensis var. chinensis]|uniref:High mobility group B protein like n=1 Tax=Actinidia chinensis var. chinensis TaxID=1590841 RepID=A0A2R6PBJ0_ACTCC|nr:High mobility group B protein like [Actinidia chinensis var. chinensis]